MYTIMKYNTHTHNQMIGMYVSSLSLSLSLYTVCACTFPPSTCLVNMTMVVGLCSHIILQKSVMVPDIGP